MNENTHMKRTQWQDYVLLRFPSDHVLQLKGKALADYQGQYKADVNCKGPTPVLWVQGQSDPLDSALCEIVSQFLLSQLTMDRGHLKHVF